jgi:hypothetical protein
MFFDSQGNLLVNLATASNAAGNPTIIQQKIAALIAAGQGFVYSTSLLTSPAGAANLGLSVFNPANSGKSILIYSIKMFYTSYAMFFLAPTSVDPALASSANVKNASLGTALASVANATYANANVASPPANNTVLEGAQAPGNSTILELLGAGNGDQPYLLPRGQANGLMLFFNSSGANSWIMTMKGVEF